jgi:hypothetical protein
MNRKQRRQATFKRAARWDRNARVEPSRVLTPILMSRTFDENEAAKISVDTRLAWHRLTHGEGTEPDFDLLANSSNVCLVLAEGLQWKPELMTRQEFEAKRELAIETVLRAEAAIEAMRDRYLRAGRWGADAAALADVPPMLDFYDDLLAHGSPRVMLDALKVTVNRMRMQQELEGSSHASN